MAGSLNRVMLIGRLTRDPELRFTPSGTAVCNLALATNRYGQDASGERREFTDYHDIVVWNQGNRKLAELCGQYLQKGRLIYVEGEAADPFVGRRPERSEALQDRGQRQRRAVPRQHRPSGRWGCAVRRWRRCRACHGPSRWRRRP